MSRLLILNEPIGPRLSVSLATEIGLKQSLLLLQLEYWLSTKGKIKDGTIWIRRSLRHFHNRFPFMPKSTIKRAIDSLIENELVIVSDAYNTRKNDKTLWYSLNPKGLKKLQSVKLVSVKKSLYQNETEPFQNGTKPFQNGTTFLNSITNDTDTPRTQEHEDESLDDDINFWMSNDIHLLPKQPVLGSMFLPKTRDKKPTGEPLHIDYHGLLYRLCYRAETDKDFRILSSTQRGKVASILGQLREANVDLSQLNKFEAWWVTNWRSRDRESGMYQPPRPEQVLELWNEAMRSGVKPMVEPDVPEEKHLDSSTLDSIMKSYRKV